MSFVYTITPEIGAAVQGRPQGWRTQLLHCADASYARSWRTIPAVRRQGVQEPRRCSGASRATGLG